MTTVAVTDDTWANDVLNADGPVLVDFWAEWCGPCKQIGPALEELSEQFEGQIKIVKVDADTNQNVVSGLGVRGIPAMFIFKDGEVVDSKIGAAPKAAIESWISDNI